MRYVVTVNGIKYDVEIEEAESIAHAASQSSPNQMHKTQQPKITQPTEIAVSTEGGEPVKAPMPGTILDIRVSPGQNVKKGDVLFILEAMKMENEIMAGTDGVVVTISTSKGTMVNTGDTLAILKYK